MTGDLILASWMILFAALLDALDGKVARMTKSSSAFGVEYDSLADVISFGLAPSVLIYSYFFSEWRHVGVFISFFPLLFGSLRLARFNVQLVGFDKSYYNGLPSPMAAIALASYILFVDEVFPEQVYPKFLVVLTLIVCLLMVSMIRYENTPRFRFRKNWVNMLMMLMLIIVIISLIIYPKKLFFPYILLYILSGPVRAAFKPGGAPGDGELKETR
jgi:CDP-diacylglycerol--serine O-phosphatidyltransferase